MSDINNLRNKMDAVTLEMINLLKTRTDIAKEIGEVKKNIGKGVADEEREDNLRGKIIQVSKEIGLDENYNIEIVNSTDSQKEPDMQNISIQKCKEKKVFWKEIAID